MSAMIVHSVPGSPFGRAVLAALEEKGAAYRLEPLAPMQMRAEPHLSRHPFGRVPVLDDNGFLLYETQAVLRYLDRVLPDPALTPADPKAAARMDQVLNISDWYLFQGPGVVIGFHRVIGPRVLGTAPDEDAIAKCMVGARRVFKALADLLGAQDYFAGSALSLADIMVAAQCGILAEAPEWADLTQPHPNLAAWYGRMAARPSFQATSWERVAAMAAAAG